MKGNRFHHAPFRKGESDTAFEIEAFVIKLINQTKNLNLAKIKKHPAEDVIWIVYKDLRSALARFLLLYQPDRYEYSEHLEAFFQGCAESGILHLWQQYGRSGIEKLTNQQLNGLIVATIIYTRSTAFKRKRDDRKKESIKNSLSLKEYFTAWQNHYSRIYVVSVKFYYHARFRPGITILEVYTHLKELNYHIRRRLGVFAHLLACCLKIKQTRKKGYYIHFGFYFKGHCHRRTYLLVDYMQGLWADITFEQGGCYSTKGLICRHDTVKREKSLVAMNDITEVKEPSQHLRMRPKGRQVFIRGQMPYKVSRKLRKKRQMLIRS